MAKSEGHSRLLSASGGLAQALAGKAAESVGNRVAGLADRLEGVVTGEPSSSSGTSLGERVVGAVGAVKDKLPLVGGGSSKSTSGSPKATKATNIIEDIDVGVPVRVAYNQWTEFGGFPTFMKKVENVQSDEDNKLTWRAQIVWSHRTWEATILEQVPDERIVWRSTGAKGHVDGAVTFHELGPNLTRILVVLEYHPKGLFERTGNLWRAQGRRARVELKHFRRHVMTQTVLDPDSVEGWRGTIEDGEVVQTHEDALAEENDEAGDQYEDEPEDEPEDQYEDEPEDDEPEDEYEEDEPEDEYEEDEPEDEYEEDEPEDEYEDEPDYEDEDEDEDERPRSRRRAS